MCYFSLTSDQDISGIVKPKAILLPLIRLGYSKRAGNELRNTPK